MSIDLPADKIPLIDISALQSPDLAERLDAARRIGQACRTVGFFYIQNHGIDAALVKSVYEQSARFFAEPQEVKEAISISKHGSNRGYVALEAESLDPSRAKDFKEAFNLGREGQAGTDVGSGEGNQWPALPGFAAILLDYFEAQIALCNTLHQAFALDLGLPEFYFSPLIDRPMATLRLLRYPPHPGVFDGQRYGAGAHTDYGNITVLSQDEVGGLEVRTRNGEWISAPPVSGAFICNIGDCLMRWSNDVYVSTPHRVLNQGARERYSVAFFFDPNPDAVIACLATCADTQRPVRYEPVKGSDYLKSRLDATYDHRREA